MHEGGEWLTLILAHVQFLESQSWKRVHQPSLTKPLSGSQLQPAPTELNPH